MQTIIKPLLAGLIVAALAISLVVASSQVLNVQADHTAAHTACQGAALAGGDPNCDGAAADSAIGAVVETIVNILSLVVGVVSVIMIIIGGLRYITSGGDAQKTAGAKNTILYAVVGLVIVIFAQVIVNYVISNIS